MAVPYFDYEQKMIDEMIKNNKFGGQTLDSYAPYPVINEEAPIEVPGIIRRPPNQVMTSDNGGIPKEVIPEPQPIPIPKISTETFSDGLALVSPEKKANTEYILNKIQQSLPKTQEEAPLTDEQRKEKTTPNWLTMLAMQLIPSIAGYAIGGAKGGAIGAESGGLANKQYMGDVEKVATDIKAKEKSIEELKSKREMAMLEAKAKALTETEKFGNESKLLDKKLAGAFAIQGGTKKELQTQSENKAMDREKVKAEATKASRENSNAIREARLAISESGLAMREASKMDNDVRAYGTELSKSNIDKTIPAVLKIDQVFKKYGKSGDIPGIGTLDWWNPMGSKEAKEMRASFYSVIVPQIKEFFGTAQSGNELQKANKMYGDNWFDGENTFRAVWPRLKESYLNDIKNMRATANQDAVAMFEKHGGTNIGNLISQLESTGGQQKGSPAPGWTGAPVGTIKNGYKRLNNPNGNDPKAWEKI